MWYLDFEYVLITSHIFRKEKRVREEDVESDESLEVILKVEGITKFSIIFTIRYSTTSITKQARCAGVTNP
jgi:hypothetical protein